MTYKPDPTLPASISVSCYVDRDTYARYRADAKRIGITMGQYVRNAVNAYHGHMMDHNPMPDYVVQRALRGSGVTITARITQVESDKIRSIVNHSGATRSHILARALHFYNTIYARNFARDGASHTQKPRAPRKTGPVKSTVSIRLPPRDEKFLRAYAKVNEISLGESVVHALGLLRERELAAAAAGPSET